MIDLNELDEVYEHLIEIVKLTKMPCAIIGDSSNNIIYGIVFGTSNMMAASVEELGIPEAGILTVIGIDPDEGDEYDTLH